MRGLVFDSNAYSSITTLIEQDNRFARYMASSYKIIDCIVVIHEAIRGGRGRIFDKDKTLKDNSILTPSKKDWLQAGYSIQKIGISKKEDLRKATNDALIASVCVESKSILVTENVKDFNRLKEHFHSLEFMSFADLKVEFEKDKERGLV